MNTHPRSSPYLSSNETRAAISANPSRQLYGNGRLLADLELRDLVSMHFVRAIGKPKGTGMRIGMFAGVEILLASPVFFFFARLLSGAPFIAVSKCVGAPHRTAGQRTAYARRAADVRSKAVK